MYYELYIDVFFLVNFLMDSLLLFSLRRLLKCSVGTGHIFLGGAAGAGLTCFIMAVPMPSWIRILISSVGINSAMIYIGLHIRRIKEFLRAFGLLYVTAFILGGILQALHPYIRTGSLFFAAAVLSYYVLNGCWKLVIRQRNLQKKICEVTLYMAGGEYPIRALVDTGNVLTDIVTGEPVSIIGKTLVKRVWGDSFGIWAVQDWEKDDSVKEIPEQVKVRYIPYKTVNGSGVMPVIRAEKMCIHMREEYWQETPLIGISSEELAEQEEYQMILNSDILGGIEHGSKSGSAAAV